MSTGIGPLQGPTHIFFLDLVNEVCRWDEHAKTCTRCRLWGERAPEQTPCGAGLRITQRIMEMLQYRY
jgi:hypothetical protein